MRSIFTPFVALFILLFLSCGSEDLSKEEQEAVKGQEVVLVPPVVMNVNPPTGSEINDFTKIVVTFYFPNGNIPADFTVSGGAITDITDAYSPTHEGQIPLDLANGNAVTVSPLDVKNVIITVPFKHRDSPSVREYALEVAWGDDNVMLSYRLMSSIVKVWASENSGEHSWFSFPIYPHADSEVVPSSIDAIKISFTENVSGILHVRRSDNDGNAIGEDHGWVTARGNQNNTLVLVKRKESRELSDGMFILEGLVKNYAGNDMKVSIPFVLTEAPLINEIFGRWRVEGSRDGTPIFTVIGKRVRREYQNVDELRIVKNSFILRDTLRWEWVLSYTFIGTRIPGLNEPGGHPSRPVRRTLLNPFPEFNTKRYHESLISLSGSVAERSGDRVRLEIENGGSIEGRYHREFQELSLRHRTKGVIGPMWILERE